jgi:hypothetical protein
MCYAAVPKCKVVILIVLWLITGASADARVRTLLQSFGQDTLQIAWNDDMIPNLTFSNDPVHFVRYYHALHQTDYATYLHSINQLRDSLKLNDWLFLELLSQSLDKILSHHGEKEKQLNLWFFLSFSGIQTALATSDDQLLTFVSINDYVYDKPLMPIGDLLWMSTSNRGGNDLDLIMPPFCPPVKAFDVSWSAIPHLRSWPQEKTYHMTFQDSTYELTVQIDGQLVQFLQQIPTLNNHHYFHLPFSQLTDRTLIHQLMMITEKMTIRQKTEFLLTFTRSAFSYQSDLSVHGQSNPMFAEEVLAHPYSDCEDRAALFFRLARVLLPLPIVVMNFDDHISIGLEVDWPCEATFSYLNKRYCVCDPTGPSDSSQTGQWPQGYENKPFDIILHMN